MSDRVAEEAMERMMKLQRGDLASACGEVTVVASGRNFGVSGRALRHWLVPSACELGNSGRGFSGFTQQSEALSWRVLEHKLKS